MDWAGPPLDTIRSLKCGLFKKKFKKIKFGKGVPVGNILKNAEAVGLGTSGTSSGREVRKLFPGPSRGPLRE
jgi:hypothetical protein